MLPLAKVLPARTSAPPPGPRGKLFNREEETSVLVADANQISFELTLQSTESSASSRPLPLLCLYYKTQAHQLFHRATALHRCVVAAIITCLLRLSSLRVRSRHRNDAQASALPCADCSRSLLVQSCIANVLSICITGTAICRRCLADSDQ